MSLDVNPRASGDAACELLEAARGGSSEALGELLQSFRAYLLLIGERELKGPLRSRVAPSDLVQETFTHGQRSIASFEGQTYEQFGLWLRGILLHRVANARRFHVEAERRSLLREAAQPARSSIVEQPGSIVDQETPSRVASRAEEAARVHAALAKLPEHYRQVIVLRNFDLLPFEAIGKAMDRPSEAARALWGRAMRRLKQELDADVLGT